MAKTKKTRGQRNDGIRSRENVLKAAFHEFSKNGFHGARVDAIAARAQINKQRIYAYYQSKRRLFTEVLKTCFAEAAKVEGAFMDFKEQDCRKLSGAILRTYFEIHRRQPWFWRLMAWENLDGGKHAGYLKGAKESSYVKLRVLYAGGQKAGIFKKNVSFEAYIFTLQAVSSFYVSNQRTLSAHLGVDLSDDATTERMISEIEKLVS